VALLSSFATFRITSTDWAVLRASVALAFAVGVRAHLLHSAGCAGSRISRDIVRPTSPNAATRSRTTCDTCDLHNAPKSILRVTLNR